MNYEILINKDNPLSKTYVPENLSEVNSLYKEGILLEKKTLESFKELQKEALKYGYKIDVMSGYRDYDYQNKIYNKLLKEKGFSYTIRSIAKPGCSEHQSGLAIDFCIYRGDNCYIEHELENLEEVKWIHQNAYRFGFILRYPYDKEEITKYNYEPWHLRYVGSLANYLYNNNLTLDEYYERKKIK